MKTKISAILIAMLVSTGFLLSAPQEAAALTGPNLVPNPNLEGGTASWIQDQWGTNDAAFSYADEGHGSAHSVKVTVSGLVDGDAKWHFEPVSVEADKGYLFSDYYKSDVTSLIVAMSLDAAGNPTYFYLGETGPSADWAKASFYFNTPANAAKLTIFHLLNVNGWLQIDDVSLSRHDSATNGNLIDNPGAENGTASWVRDRWGSNTAAFSQENTGHNSAHSLKVTVTNHIDGDAKWHFAPVPVQGNQDYLFSDYYKSNVTSLAVVMSVDATGNPTYFYLGELAPAANWTKAEFRLHTPPGSRLLSVFHLLNANGWLQIDDQDLRAATPTIDPQLIPNGSVETASPANPSLPNKWSHSSWGDNNPAYAYLNEGRTGARSLKLTMSGYVSGDAKWVYEPQDVQRGKDYRFRVWYKTDTIPHAVVEFLKDDGSYYYFGLPDPEPSGTDWQEYNAVFSVPADAGQAAVFLFLDSNGWVQTDDYELSPYAYAGFDSARVSLVFDDGFESNISTALPVLDQHGFKTTHCYSTIHIQEQPGQENTVRAITDAGHEACSHTVNHFDLRDLSPEQAESELRDSKAYLQSILGTTTPITSFTSPYGGYDSGIVTQIQNHYAAHRTTNEGYNSRDTLDPYRLFTQNMQAGTALSQFQAWVNKAIADKTWLVLTYHEIVPAGETPDEFDTRKADFDAQMAWLAGTGVKVERLDQALTELKAQ